MVRERLTILILATNVIKITVAALENPHSQNAVLTSCCLKDNQSSLMNKCNSLFFKKYKSVPELLNFKNFHLNHFLLYSNTRIIIPTDYVNDKYVCVCI